MKMLPAGGRVAYVVGPGMGQVGYAISEMPDDPDGQVETTIGLMRQYVTEDLEDQRLQNDVMLARKTGDPITDTWCYLRRGGDRGMEFVRDEVTASPFAEYEYLRPGMWRPFVESLARPELLAKTSNPHGDCDCFCGYGAAHLLLNAVATSFCTVATDARDPTIYSHVYLVTYPSSGLYAGERVPLDLSHGPYPGWETQNKYGKRREWPLQMGNAGVVVLAAAAAIGAWLCYRRGILR